MQIPLRKPTPLGSSPERRIQFRRTRIRTPGHKASQRFLQLRHPHASQGTELTPNPRRGLRRKRYHSFDPVTGRPRHPSRPVVPGQPSHLGRLPDQRKVLDQGRGIPTNLTESGRDHRPGPTTGRQPTPRDRNHPQHHRGTARNSPTQTPWVLHSRPPHPARGRSSTIPVTPQPATAQRHQHVPIPHVTISIHPPVPAPARTQQPDTPHETQHRSRVSDLGTRRPRHVI